MCYARRGGARVGAGRPKKRGAIHHDKRPEMKECEPVHVTLCVFGHVYNLRSRRCFEVIRAALRAVTLLSGLRVVGVAIEGNHIHMLIEAAETAALSCGMHLLQVRIARGLHRVMSHRGAVFEDRYNLHVLKTPRETDLAIGYVLGNTAKHAAEAGRPLTAGYRDPYTFGYFGDCVALPIGTADLVSPPETWLLRDGWRLARGSSPASARVVRERPTAPPASHHLSLFVAVPARRREARAVTIPRSWGVASRKRCGVRRPSWFAVVGGFG